MMYAYEDLSSEQFEVLVVAICQFLLGAGVQGFAAGADGGRDAKFVGTAELLPSTANPWSGTVIIQAKHTNGLNKSFTESDFFSVRSESTVIGEELPRIARLRASKSLDHYLLFANRTLTGNGESLVRDHIASNAGLPIESVFLCGVEQLEVYLRRFPQAATIADINALDCPLIVSPAQLAEIVEALSVNLSAVASKLDDAPMSRTSYEEKNRINGMTEKYARQFRKYYLKETHQIRGFLADPDNAAMLSLYLSVVEEFQLKILAKRRDYNSFDEVMNYLFDLLFQRDPVLRSQKRLTRALLFYMYWNCDLGDDADDA